MLETSRDVLNLLLGFSVLLLAIWLSWIFYQVGKTLQNVNKTISGIQKATESFTQLMHKFKEKTNSAGAYLTVLLKSGQQILEFVKTKKDKTARKKSRAKDSKQK
jgi:hypothetical protein